MPRFGTVDTQYLDSSGNPLANGLLYFYESGTTTPKTTYSDINLTIANTNPVVLEADGRQPDIFFDGSAKIILTDSSYVQIKQLDPVGGDSGAQLDAWSAITVYGAGDFVIGSDGEVYASLSAGNQNNDPTTSPAFWEKKIILGVWNANITYTTNDLVQASDGYIYSSLVAGNLNNDPSTGDGTKWKPATTPYTVGDVVFSADTTKYTTPSYIPCDGLEFSAATYPKLATKIPSWYKKLADPATLPTGAPSGLGKSLSWSKSDDTYLAFAHSTSPFITIYKRSGDTFTKLSDPATLPPSNGRGVDFDNTDGFLAVAHNGTPFITIYQRSGDTFTKLSDPATIPTGVGSDATFGPLSGHLAVGHATTPFITVYSISGTTFTKLADPATLPPDTVYETCIDSTETYFFVAHQTTPFITIYKRAGSTLTKLSNPATLPSGTCLACAVDSTDTYWAVGSSSSPYVLIYKRVGDVFTKLADIAGFPAGQVDGVYFDSSGDLYCAVSSTGDEIVKIERSGDVFTVVKTDFVTYNDVAANRTIGMSQTNTYSAISGATSPYVAIYKDGTYISPLIDVDTNDHVTAYINTGE